jgi:hypothetical protein
MRTEVWQKKQLQTQLASWAELRHDTLLYAKQSYTGVPGCEYPAGYVEPYPALYARLRTFAERAAKQLSEVALIPPDPSHHGQFKQIRDQHLRYFARMSSIMSTLESIASKELEAQPLSPQEAKFLEQVVDQRGNVKAGSGQRPQFDGWYCDLIYGDRGSVMDWVPTVADVHTDPESRSVLHVGVGDTNLCVIAIDNDDDRAVYVGPVYSYYEFRHSAESRLTDVEWQNMLGSGNAPRRPAWVDGFQAKPAQR